jgi:hypothetical protein
MIGMGHDETLPANNENNLPLISSPTRGEENLLGINLYPLTIDGEGKVGVHFAVSPRFNPSRRRRRILGVIF